MEQEVNQTITPTENQPAPQQPPVKKWNTLVIAILVVIIVVLLGVVIYFWKTNQNRNSTPNVTPTPTVIDSPTPTPTVQGENGEQKPEQYISIAWLPAWQEIPSEPNEGKAFKVGKVLDGQYKDLDVYIAVEEGMGTSYSHYLVKDSNSLFFYSENIKIKGIDDLPKTIKMPSSGYVLQKNEFASEKFADVVKKFKVFTDPIFGDIYLTNQDCFVAELPNHLAVSFDYQIPFVSKETRLVDVTFKDGVKNADTYTYNKIIGCVAQCFYLNIQDETKLKPQERLTETGTTVNGEKLYEFSDPNTKELKDLYNDKNTVAYFSEGYEQLGKNKYSYNDFIKMHPLLYWKDPIGRWVEMRNDKFQTAAEMCKPVIYLYPTKPTEMSVWVAPNGGFMFTEPQYNNGWKVLAKPDGTVQNLADGKEYPYLFWEGIGLNYPPQDAGFVIKTEQLEKFLTDKAGAVGLVGRELQDFKDYWVPRLKGLNKPYLKITFLKKEQMDEIAPLDLSVKPNSVIRVMMTAKGLDAYENLPAQELPVPGARKGFTLVEWGGAVLR